MPIFQKSVIQKHLADLVQSQLDAAFNRFQQNYSVDKIQQIKTLKEEEYQDGFLRDIFVNVLDYTLKPAANFNLVREFKNQTDGKKADGAILKDGNAIAVIELKSTKTKDLTSITEQAFNYKNNQPHCQYVITSNFQKLRFYIDYSNEYEEFDLFYLDKKAFASLYLILNKDNLLNGLPSQLKNETKCHEENISAQFYKDYSKFKQDIFANLTQNNPPFDQLLLFKKSQKLLDRLLFVFFAEDTGLVPPNSMATEVENWQRLTELDAYDSLYNRLKKFFSHLNKGHQDIPAYNGGLFAADPILDKLDLVIADEVLKDNLLKLAAYDFNTELDVNILGHIFEHSLNELEEMSAKIDGKAAIQGNTKRKKDGIFYTPKYITQYIVENTLGTLCAEKRQQLNLVDIEFDESYWKKDTSLSAKGKKLFKTLEAYKDWLLTLKILDPACGSGAFLNQALNFLIAEHQEINHIIADLTHAMPKFYNTDKMILEKNIYGVDINEESVEIAQLSLWLRTAKKGRKLSKLSGNIKCGNSLIDDPAVAGDKAFDWNKEFPKIMANGGFDVVIGNPPYGAKLEKEVQQYLNEHYIKGASETAISFIKLSFDLLKKGGQSGFIIPKSFSYASNYQAIREFLISNFTEIVDCKKVWKEVKLEQIMLFFSKEIHIENYQTAVLKDKSVLTVGTVPKKIVSQFGLFLNDISNAELNLAIKIKSDDSYLNDIAHNSRGGIFQKYLSPNGDTAVLGGAEIQREGIVGIKSRIDKKVITNDQKSFINDNSVLVQRIVAHIEKPVDHIKITACIPVDKNYAIVDTISQITIQDQYSQQYIWLLLNSKLINWYAYRFIYGKAIRTMQFDNPVTSRIPIKKISIEKQQPFIQKADLMLALNKYLQEKKTKFINRITSNLAITKISKKLENFYHFDFKTFIAELNKQKVTLTLVQQDEWEEYFTAYQTEINQLQVKIDKTDQKIDKMVYALYGLTEEEIGIVEGNV